MRHPDRHVVSPHLITWTINGKAIPSEVDEGLRPRYVAAAHRWREGPCESSVILTELGVAIAIRVSLSILDPEEHQRHVGTFELTVEVGKIGHRFGLSGQTIETLRRCRQGRLEAANTGQPALPV